MNLTDIYNKTKEKSFTEISPENDKNEIANYLEVIDQVKNEVRDKLSKFSQNINDDKSQFLPKFEEEEIVKLTLNFTPVSTDDMEQQSLNFKQIEEILLNDIESFFIIWKQYMDQNALITAEERCKSVSAQSNFSTNTLCGMMLTNSGEIYDINKQMQHSELGMDFNMLIGFNFYDILFSD